MRTVFVLKFFDLMREEFYGKIFNKHANQNRFGSKKEKKIFLNIFMLYCFFVTVLRYKRIGIQGAFDDDGRLIECFIGICRHSWLAHFPLRYQKEPKSEWSKKNKRHAMSLLPSTVLLQKLPEFPPFFCSSNFSCCCCCLSPSLECISKESGQFSAKKNSFRQ